MAEITPIALSELTTLRTGGAPTHMVDARTSDELVHVLREVWSDGEPWFVLGGGSNLLVGDEPFEGTVVRVLSTGIQWLGTPRERVVRVRAEAGHSWDALVEYSVNSGLAGIEAMSGIPGTVGAVPIQNVGAYGQDVAQTLVEVELLDEVSGERSVVPASELELGLRTSVLKHHYGEVAERSAVVLSVTLDLEDVGRGRRPVRSEQLARALGVEVGSNAPLTWVRERVLEIRRSKGMVLDPEDKDSASAGSFFQNPVVSASFARTLPADAPQWPVAEAFAPMTVIPLAAYTGTVRPAAATNPDVKLSAAWLIEQVGLRKGFRLPDSRARLSTKHALALTNRGHATAAEIAQLARFIRSRVHAEFGLMLKPEPVLIGVEL